MLAWLLNASSLCFFISEMIKIHRRWRARKVMDSTSFEGTIIHVTGNTLITIYALYVGAWVTVVAELILTVIALVTLYWKFKWLRNEYDWHLLCALKHKWYYYQGKGEKYRHCQRCFKIQVWYGIHDGCMPHWYWKDVKE